MNKQYFKWYDAAESKPTQDVRVLLKIQSEANPVVGYWSSEGWGWEVCTDNLCWSDYYSQGEVIPEFYDSEVVAYMYIDVCGDP